MKAIRTIGLVGLTVLAATLFGASSAAGSNTALCAKDAVGLAEEQCPKNEAYSHVHAATLSGNENRAKLLTNLATLQCAVLFLGDVKPETLEGAPLIVNGTFSYSSCNLGCSATQVSSVTEIKILWTGHETAEVTGAGEVLVNCPILGVHCIYKGEGLKATAIGPLLAGAEMPNGEIKLEEQTVKKSDALNACPETATLDLLLGPLSTTYLAAKANGALPDGSTVLCAEDTVGFTGENCPSGVTTSHVHVATLSGNENRAKLLTPLATLQCAVLFLGDVKPENLEGAPLIVNGTFSYSNCNLGCSATQVSSVTELKILWTGHETAEVTGAGEVLVNCPGLGVHCTYKGEGLKATAIGPLLAGAEMPNGEIKLEEQTVKSSDGLLGCPSTATLDLLLGPLSATYLAAGSAGVQSGDTALCQVDTVKEGPCPAGKLVSHIHDVTLAGAKSKLLAGETTIECEVLFLGDVLSKGLLGKPLSITGQFTYSFCNEGCEATQLGEGSAITVSKLGHETAYLTGDGEVLINCAKLGIHCVYSGKGLKATVSGPLLASSEMPNGEVWIQKQQLEQASALEKCPKTAQLDLLLGPLEAVYISS